MSLLKAPAVQMLRWPPIGRPAASIANRLGAQRLSRKISGLCDFVVPIVPVEIPARYGAGKSFRMNGQDGRDGVARTIWFQGWYGFEPPMPDLFAALAMRSKRVLDVGSYSGFYSLLAATVSPDVRVLALDPFPQAQRLFKANVELNGLSDRVRLLPVAASDKPGSAPLYIPPTNTRLVEMASSLVEWHRNDHQEVIQVQVTTLDAVVAEQNAGPVDLIKMDVENLEATVLRGGKNMLREQRPVVFVEVLEGFDFETVGNLARECDYRCGVLTDKGLVWSDPIKADPNFPNQVFCPREKSESVEQLAAEVCPRPA
jgi:FkbM family methyltransferase